MSFSLPDLPYEYDALEPTIDAETMKIHHTKHHQGYIKKLNDALRGTEWESAELDDLLRRLDEVDEDIREAVRNNGGGHFNHSLFWRCLLPTGGAAQEPNGDLRDAIDEAFGSVDAMRSEFAEAASSRFGSGWAWLCIDPERGLHIVSTANQDTPIMPRSLGGEGPSHIPVLGLDVWEHAYYLKHKNDRGAYIENWWSVVNWESAAQRFKRAATGATV